MNKPLWVILAIGLIYTLCGFFLAPYLVGSQIKTYVTQTLDRQLDLGKVRVNPYALTLDISKLALKEANGSPLFSFDRFRVNFQAASLFRRAWSFSEVLIDKPQVTINIRPDNSLNLARLIADAAPPKKKNAQPPPKSGKKKPALPRLYFERIALNGSRINLSDRSDPTPADISLSDINLELSELRTLPDKSGRYILKGIFPDDGTLTCKGAIALNPLSITGQIVLKDIKPATIWPFLQDELNLAEPKGMVTLATQYRLVAENNKTYLAFDDIRLQATDLALHLKDAKDPMVAVGNIDLSDARYDLTTQALTIGKLVFNRGQVAVLTDKKGRNNWTRMGAEPPQNPAPQKKSPPAKKDSARRPPFHYTIESVALEDIALTYRDFNRPVPIGADVARIDAALSLKQDPAAPAGQIRIEASGIDLFDTSLRQIDEPEILASIPAIKIRDGLLDFARRKVTIRDIDLVEGGVSVWRDEKGALNWSRTFGATDTDTDNSAKNEDMSAGNTSDNAPAWSVLLSSIKLDRFGLRLADRALDKPTIYDLKNIHFKLNNFQNNPDKAFDFNLALEVAGGGNGTIAGTANLFLPKIKATVKINDLPLTPLGPYLKSMARLTFDSGHVSTHANLVYGNSLSGKMRLTGDLRLNSILFSLPDTKEPLVSWKFLDLRKIDFSLAPGRFSVDEVILSEPFAKLVIQPDSRLNFHDIFPPKNELQKPKAEPGPETGEQKFAFDINRIQIENGRLDFSDLTLKPRFGADIRELSGTIAGLSSNPESNAAMLLNGRVQAYGTAKIKGDLRVADPKGYSRVEMIFRNINMPDFSPYTAKFAGRKVASGKLSLDLGYQLTQRQLKGNNNILIDNLVLGERIESPTALDIPLDLALALLKDTEGRINIELPVSGDLNDPEFSYGHIIWKALTNLLTKIVTSPFRAITALIGSDADDFDTVLFDAGSGVITPPQAEKIDLLETALQQRPRLAVAVQGTFDPELDTKALQSIAIRNEIAHRMGKPLDENKPPATLLLSDPAVRQTIVSLAAERLDPIVLAQLKKPPAPSSENKSGQTKPSGKPAPAPAETIPNPTLFYAQLLEHLAAQVPIDETALKTLAKQRAHAVIAELTKNDRMTSERLTIKDPIAAPKIENGLITCTLSLSALK